MLGPSKDKVARVKSGGVRRRLSDLLYYIQGRKYLTEERCVYLISKCLTLLVSLLLLPKILDAIDSKVFTVRAHPRIERL